MKDARGHGSNPRGITSVRYKVKDPTWTGTVITHGSNAKGSHAAGVEKVGQRYHVQIQPYSLGIADPQQLGRSLGRDQTISMHRSLNAAGKRLGSLISGKNAKVPQSIAGTGNGYRAVVVDQMTGHKFSRNSAKAGVPLHLWNGYGNKRK